MCPAYEMKPGILHAVISAGCFVGIPELATAAGIPAGFWFVYGGAAGAGRGERETHMYAKRGKTS